MAVNSDLAFLDSGVILNLLASGYASELLTKAGLACATAQGVESIEFSLWPSVDPLPEQEIEREVVVAKSLVKLGMLTLYKTDQYVDEFVSLAVHLSDGQAKAVALAASNAAFLVTDDRRTRKVITDLGLTVPMLSSLSLLNRWANSGSPKIELVAHAAYNMSKRAKFRPSNKDEQYTWWSSLERLQETPEQTPSC